MGRRSVVGCAFGEQVDLVALLFARDEYPKPRRREMNVDARLWGRQHRQAGKKGRKFVEEETATMTWTLTTDSWSPSMS